LKRGFWVLPPLHYKEGGNILRRIRLVLTISLIVVVLITTALPAAAQGLGPAVFCDEGTFERCTESARLNSSQESFICEGLGRDAASCTNRRTGETSPYCVFMGHESSEGRDAYLCGPRPASR
jgi:hypothetical protein